jgi:O-acetyl-ADP-ribose deacetylase (regulator of RNase III)
MIEFITGNLLEATEKYIVHQANCRSHYASGIAAAIYDKFPYSNIYVTRIRPDTPGDIIICGDGITQRYVVNLLGQYNPGGLSEDERDNEAARKKYFHQGLLKLTKVPNLESVAFNYRIGCGIAGGNWEWYLGTLDNFAKYVYDKQRAKVVIYNREGDI